MGEASGHDGTVGKALSVLDRVASFGRPVRFSELLEVAPFPKATLYRFVQTLTNQGMLVYDPDRQTYAPGLRLVRLAHAAWERASLGPIARPHLDALSVRVGETIHLAQLDHGQVFYVDKRNAARPVEMFSSAGRIGPAYCTGVGKAMLAHMPEPGLSDLVAQQSFHRFTPATITDERTFRAELADIRARRVAFDREEHEPGIICAAVPILSARGRCLGALSITAPVRRSSVEALGEIAPLLSETADRIAGDAADWRFPEA